jgi:hypothetical protein
MQLFTCKTNPATKTVIDLAEKKTSKGNLIALNRKKLTGLYSTNKLRFCLFICYVTYFSRIKNGDLQDQHHWRKQSEDLQKT